MSSPADGDGAAAAAAPAGGGADGAGEEEEAAVTAIRRRRRAAGLRKRARSATPPGAGAAAPADGAAAGAAEAEAAKLSETRELQRQRRWRLNCSGGVKREVAEEAEQDKGALKTLETAFDRQKKAQSAMSDKHDALRQAYIEAQLQLRRREAGDIADAPGAEAQPAGFTNPDDAVLALGGDSLTSTVDRREVGNKWLTGIQEIQLPLQYKIRCIEETEQAKALAMGDVAALKAGTGGHGPDDPAHHKRFAYNRQEGLTAAAAQLVGTGGGADRAVPTSNTFVEKQLQQKEAASDERLFRKWKQRQRLGVRALRHPPK